MFKRLTARVVCALSGHQWMRKRRTIGNTGTQKCRRCGHERTTALRPHAKRQNAADFVGTR